MSNRRTRIRDRGFFSSIFGIPTRQVAPLPKRPQTPKSKITRSQAGIEVDIEVNINPVPKPSRPKMPSMPKVNIPKITRRRRR